MGVHACAALKASVLLAVLLCSLHSCAEAAGNAQPLRQSTNGMYAQMFSIAIDACLAVMQRLQYSADCCRVTHCFLAQNQLTMS